MTYSLLETAPDHLSPEFIKYIRDNNVVVHEDRHWIVIENCKYHMQSSKWHTAFWKADGIPRHAVPSFHKKFYTGWEIRIKHQDKRTVARWHVHFIERC